MAKTIADNGLGGTIIGVTDSVPIQKQPCVLAMFTGRLYC